MSNNTLVKLSAMALSLLAWAVQPALADNPCQDLPDHAALTRALKHVVAVGDPKANGGLALNMWATVVARDGTVCAVTFTGLDWGDQWPGSRVISAQKANTANAFSLPQLALSTANLFSAVQGGGSLFGLQFSNPVDPAVAYAGTANQFGTPEDPLVGKRIGGINVFGGGLALYTAAGKLVGGLGAACWTRGSSSTRAPRPVARPPHGRRQGGGVRSAVRRIGVAWGGARSHGRGTPFRS